MQLIDIHKVKQCYEADENFALEYQLAAKVLVKAVCFLVKASFFLVKAMLQKRQ